MSYKSILCDLSHPCINHSTMPKEQESLNHVYWRRPLILSPTVNLTPSPLNHVLKYYINMIFDQWFHQCPGHPISVLGHTFSDDIFPNIFLISSLNLPWHNTRPLFGLNWSIFGHYWYFKPRCSRVARSQLAVLLF